MIPIDDQIAHEIEQFELHAQIHGEADPMMAEKIASLEELKRIREVQVPEGEVFTCGSCGFPQMVKRSDYDTLRDLLKRESARASEWEAEAGNQFQYAGRVLEQANAAEAQRDACAQMNDDQASRVYKAESKLAAIEKMGREPSEGMLSVPPHFKYVRAFTAMFAKMMEELK
jgi:hypothetical protein